MAASGFTVTAARLKQTAEELAALSEQYRGKVENLSSLEMELRAMWEGEANNAFRIAFANDKVQLDNFYQVAMRYVTALNEATTDYANAEMRATEIANTRTYK